MYFYLIILVNFGNNLYIVVDKYDCEVIFVVVV